MAFTGFHTTEESLAEMKNLTSQLNMSDSEFMRLAMQEKITRCQTQEESEAEEPPINNGRYYQMMDRLTAVEVQLTTIREGLFEVKTGPSGELIADPERALIPPLVGHIEAVQQHLGEIRDQNRGLSERVNGLERELKTTMQGSSPGTSEALLTDLLARVTAIEGQNTAIKEVCETTVGHLPSKEKLTMLHAGIQGLQTKMPLLEEQNRLLKELLEEVGELKKGRSGVPANETMGTLQGRIGGMEQRLQSMSERWVKLDNSLVKVGQDVAEIAKAQPLDALNHLTRTVQEGLTRVPQGVGTVVETTLKNLRPATSLELKTVREGMEKVEKIALATHKRTTPSLTEQLSHWLQASSFLLLVGVIISLASFTYAMYFFSSNLPALPETPPGYMLVPITPATLPEEPAKGSPAENAKPNQSAARGRR